MLIDRDLMIEVFGNVSGFAKEGIALETAWNPLESNVVISSLQLP